VIALCTYVLWHLDDLSNPRRVVALQRRSNFRVGLSGHKPASYLLCAHRRSTSYQAAKKFIAVHKRAIVFMNKNDLVIQLLYCSAQSEQITHLETMLLTLPSNLTETYVIVYPREESGAVDRFYEVVVRSRS
jgi:hypothetical protein